MFLIVLLFFNRNLQDSLVYQNRAGLEISFEPVRIWSDFQDPFCVLQEQRPGCRQVGQLGRFNYDPVRRQNQKAIQFISADSQGII